MHAPNLYQYLRLDRGDNSTSLGVLLAGRDAQLAASGFEESTAARREVITAYSVLSSDVTRALYDQAVDSGRVVSWAQLEHLGNFGSWPADYTGWTEPVGYEYPAQVNAAAPVWGKPTGVVDYAGMTQRASADVRSGLAIVDFLIASALSAAVAVPVGELLDSDFGEFLSAILGALVMVAYIIVPEVLWGGSPAKLMLGYEVRDVRTGGRLSPAQSAKRNWFRLVQLVPLVGSLVGLIGAVALIISVNPENALRGSHDRAAGAEVVKKRPQL